MIGYGERVVVYDPAGQHAGVGGIRTLSRSLRALACDSAIIFPGSVKVALAAAWAHIPKRIGWDPGRQMSAQMIDVIYPEAMRELPFVRSILRFERLYRLSRPIRTLLPSLFTETVPPGGGQHMTSRFLSALSSITATRHTVADPPWLGIPDDVRRAVEQRYPASGKRRVLLAPGAGMPTRRWPWERFARLAKQLADARFDVVLFGGAAERALCERILGAADTSGVLSAAGVLSVPESLALVAASSVLVAHDSAPMHMASALGTPVIALFGPTVPSFGFAPLSPGRNILEVTGLPCRPCTVYGSLRCPVGTHECMHAISVENVFQAVLDAVERDTAR